MKKPGEYKVTTQLQHGLISELHCHGAVCCRMLLTICSCLKESCTMLEEGRELSEWKM